MLGALRKAGTKVFILSTSWWPVTAEQWRAYLLLCDSVTKLGFDADHIIALGVKSPGKGADKGAAIQSKLQDLGVSPGQCLFADDASDNIQSATKKCDTLWVQQRRGLEESDMHFVMSRAAVTNNSPVQPREQYSVTSVVGIAIGCSVVSLIIGAALATYCGKTSTKTGQDGQGDNLLQPHGE